MKIKLKTWMREKNLNYLNERMVLEIGKEKFESRFIVDTGSPKTIIGFSKGMRVKFKLTLPNPEGSRLLRRASSA
ncbi:MAG: hypothetical protein WC595_02185 [Candidatus Nanoarchaeia archaeon]